MIGKPLTTIYDGAPLPALYLMDSQFRSLEIFLNILLRLGVEANIKVATTDRQDVVSKFAW